MTAVDYNEKIGLLALALIDKEVKIYKIRQQGTKNALCELFSFFTYFPSGAATSCLQIEKFVTNGRPIICLGSQMGDIAIYYLDDDRAKREARGGPTCLTKFHFNHRGSKFPERDGEHEDGTETDY